MSFSFHVSNMIELDSYRQPFLSEEWSAWKKNVERIYIKREGGKEKKRNQWLKSQMIKTKAEKLITRTKTCCQQSIHGFLLLITFVMFPLIELHQKTYQQPYCYNDVMKLTIVCISNMQNVQKNVVGILNPSKLCNQAHAKLWYNFRDHASAKTPLNLLL